MAPNDIYILLSYSASAVILVAMAVISWRAKKKDERDLRKLEQQVRDLSNEVS